MTTFVLASPREADDLIRAPFSGPANRAFSARAKTTPSSQMPPGSILAGSNPFPIPDDTVPDDDASEETAQQETTRRLSERYTLAVRRGQYEWVPPKPAADAKAALEAVLVKLPEGKTQRPMSKGAKASCAARWILWRRSRHASACFIRASTPTPLPQMPYRRPLSIVADTSGISQGGLDFVARFLCPVARTKVPAISHMEVVNFSQRFLSNSRSGDVRALDLLMDHLRSQGSQRAVLRLEFHSDIEIERTFLLGDPLRSAFAKDNDKDISSLNLNPPTCRHTLTA